MNITTLINAIRDAIKGDDNTINWCASTYGQAQTVYKGVDQRNPPAVADYPVVHLFPVSKIAGYELEREDHVIGIVCGVYDDTVTTTTAADPEAGDEVTVKEYAAIDDLETFRKYVETAAIGAVTAPRRVEVMTVEYEVIEFFPFLLASMELRISDDYYSGDDAFK